MKHREQTLLFTNQRMADLSTTVKDRVMVDIKESVSSYKGPEPSVSRDELKKKYKIHIARITDKVIRVVDDTVECVIRFEGSNGTYFHYAPSKQLQVDKPEGYAISDCVIMYFPKSDDTAALKEEINDNYEDFMAWYNALTEEATAYNNALSGIIDSAFDEYDQRVNADKSLEDELNS